MPKRLSRTFLPISAGVVLIVVLFVELRLHPVTNWFRTRDWRWTGLFEYTIKRTEEKKPKGIEKDPDGRLITKITEEVQTGKTGWDYLQLAGTVAVPLVLGFGGIWLNQQEQRRAEENRQREREGVEENLREAALQTYLDRISELLLNNNLRQPNQENNPAQDIARARTLTVLDRLGEDDSRTVAILRFLYEAELIKGQQPVVKLHGANLSKAILWQANLSGANLSGAILWQANLSGGIRNGAILSEANLIEANLQYADLMGADLQKADLMGAELYQANLSGAILREANLNAADLREANLSGADLSGADLTEADLRGANLSGTNLSETELSEADLRGPELSDGIQRGDSLSETERIEVERSVAEATVIELSGPNLKMAIYTDSTSFPDGFDPEKAGMLKED